MKALSIHPLFALNIFFMEKTVEVRTWTTKYRGDLLICSTAKKFRNTIPSHALCVVNLKDVVPLNRKHLKAAQMLPEDYDPNAFAWIIEDVRKIRPFFVKGKLGLWECDHKIEYIENNSGNKERDEQLFERIYKPFLFTGNKEEW